MHLTNCQWRQLTELQSYHSKLLMCVFLPTGVKYYFGEWKCACLSLSSRQNYHLWMVSLLNNFQVSVSTNIVSIIKVPMKTKLTLNIAVFIINKLSMNTFICPCNLYWKTLTSHPPSLPATCHSHELANDNDLINSRWRFCEFQFKMEVLRIVDTSPSTSWIHHGWYSLSYRNYITIIFHQVCQDCKIIQLILDYIRYNEEK